MLERYIEAHIRTQSQARCRPRQRTKCVYCFWILQFFTANFPSFLMLNHIRLAQSTALMRRVTTEPLNKPICVRAYEINWEQQNQQRFISFFIFLFSKAHTQSWTRTEQNYYSISKIIRWRMHRCKTEENKIECVTVAIANLQFEHNRSAPFLVYRLSFVFVSLYRCNAFASANLLFALRLFSD